MANLGNAWHIPGNPEPRDLSAMRSPIGAIVPGAEITICSGNQFQGGGNAGNQLGDGSALLFKRSAASTWTEFALLFHGEAGNNKYFAATIPAGTFQVGDVVQYYLRIPYDDHDTTFLFQAGAFSASSDSEMTARATPFTFVVEDSARKGQWGPVFALPNVAIHTHVLPSGQVLMWGRRDQPFLSLDVHECTPFVWNPSDGSVVNTNQPARSDGTKVNLFCSGHSFLADGRLLVVGGHNRDGDGLSQASVFDYRSNAWAPTAPMSTPNNEEVRRWYPTATTLPNGNVLVASGSFIDPTLPQGQQTTVVDLLQIWDNGTWQTIGTADGAPLNYFGLPLYPRMHVAADGQVFMSGPNDRTLLLQTNAPGQWSELAFRALGGREYAASVLYDADQVAYIGGGNDAGTQLPTAGVEFIDLAVAKPRWQQTAPMNNRRRQHNAVVLPDGTVLVTGGTRGGGGPNNGFNDLDPGSPVFVAELWDPKSGTWSELAAEAVPRCYHATAVLLPDGSVLSAGGGEYRPDNINDNAPEDSHRNGQRFFPPYFFKGARPSISAPPAAIDYAQPFQVGTPDAAQIAQVTLLRLASVTHSFDHNQRFVSLSFAIVGASLQVNAPASPNQCPPGHYLLFFVNQAGVPSVAAIVQVRPLAAARPAVFAPTAARPIAADAAVIPAAPRQRTYLQVHDRAAHLERTATGTTLLVGVTGTCPYGIGACWGGAYEALGRLDAVASVMPVPNVDDSTATVHLVDQRLPELALWQTQFRSIVNGSYVLRGVELTLHGALELHDSQLFISATLQRPSVRLEVLDASNKLQWDHDARATKPLSPAEAGAFARLLDHLRQDPQHRSARVTGPLEQLAGVYTLRVRLFSFTA